MGHFWLFRLFAKHSFDDDQSSGSSSIRSVRKTGLKKSPIDPSVASTSLASTHPAEAFASSSSSMSLPNVQYNAACISSEIRRGANGRGQYTVFRVHVTCDSEQWWLFKRYSEFRALHAQVRIINVIAM
jgi:hypothetical protein